MKAIKGIVFDLYGTLYRREPAGYDAGYLFTSTGASR